MNKSRFGRAMSVMRLGVFFRIASSRYIQGKIPPKMALERSKDLVTLNPHTGLGSLV